MKIEDVEVGMEVEIISTLFTDDELGYHEDGMLSVGDSGEVEYVDYEDNSVQLSDSYWYSVKDLEPCKESYSEAQQVPDNANIGNLTVSISLEDKKEIAKDILKVVLQELYVGIEALSASLTKDLDEGGVSGDVTPKESLVTEQDVLNNLLNQINCAIDMGDEETALKLSEAYQRIKSV